jgi:hypothetical protein
LLRIPKTIARLQAHLNKDWPWTAQFLQMKAQVVGPLGDLSSLILVISNMPSNRKSNSKKRAREDDGVPTPRLAKKARVLSPLRSKDREDSARTREKIIIELRNELTIYKAQASEAARLKQQRDFTVHVAASLSNLQSKIFDAWLGDIVKSKGMKSYEKSFEEFHDMENKALKLEELLSWYPRFAECLKADISKEEIESLNGWIEDFKVSMVGKDGREREYSSEASFSD